MQTIWPLRSHGVVSNSEEIFSRIHLGFDMPDPLKISDIIVDVLSSIRGQWYADRPREFLRDERALMKAVSRYGHECNERGWEFDARAIRVELLNLLQEIKRSGVEIGYLPVYLHGAVGRHIGQRAEELSARAKAAAPRAAKIVAGVRAAIVIEKTDVEVLAAVYADLKSRRRPRAKAKQPTEPTLF